MAFLSVIFMVVIMTSNPCLSAFTTGTSKLPRTGRNFAIAYDSNTSTILIFGGYKDSAQFVTFKDHTFTDEGEKYLTSEQETGQWSQHYLQLGDELWMIQSSGAAFVKVNTKTYARTVPATSFPDTVNDGGCLAGTDSHLFVIGGGDAEAGSNAMKTTQIYRISDGTWLQNVPSLNTQRMSLSCIVYDNILYAFGGSDGSTYLDSIETLDISNMDTISTKEWTTDLVQALKSGRKATRSVIYGTDIYVIGGKDNNGERVADINVIDTFTGSVSYGDTLDYATSYASSIIVGNTLYVFGGFLNSDLDTYQYSILPTKDPSAAPTSPPSDDPTLRPTKNPTNTPTSPPSDAPTSPPSDDPTLHPSYAPTLFPSDAPSFTAKQRPSTSSIFAIISPTIAVTDDEAAAISHTINMTDDESSDNMSDNNQLHANNTDVLLIVSVSVVAALLICLVLFASYFYIYRKRVLKKECDSKRLEELQVEDCVQTSGVIQVVEEQNGNKGNDESSSSTFSVSNATKKDTTKQSEEYVTTQAMKQDKIALGEITTKGE